MIRATILRPDGTEGLYAFFHSIDEARSWIAYYLSHPSFAGHSAVIEYDFAYVTHASRDEPDHAHISLAPPPRPRYNPPSGLVR